MQGFLALTPTPHRPCILHGSLLASSSSTLSELTNTNTNTKTKTSFLALTPTNPQTQRCCQRASSPSRFREYLAGAASLLVVGPRFAGQVVASAETPAAIGDVLVDVDVDVDRSGILERKQQTKKKPRRTLQLGKLRRALRSRVRT
jgi:hypothetical protein